MKPSRWLLLLLLIAGTAYVAFRQQSAPYRHCEGKIFGTYYSITYKSGEDLDADILRALNAVDNSLSMFNGKSTVSRLNRGEDVEADRLLTHLLPRAAEISEKTDGAFDITVAPLVNVWGFGFKGGEWPSDEEIDSIRQFVGYEKVRLNGRKLQKDDARTMIDFSAIAKGYGSDMAAQVLDNAKVKNYMVEIGGEVVVKGRNKKSEKWRIGVLKPTENQEPQEYQCILQLTDCAAATSGNYRNFFYKDGKRYAHTIDPHTGHPVQQDIISATVIAPHCYEADAYATAFMVMGLEKAKQVLAKQRHLQAYFVYVADDEQKVWSTDGFEKFIVW